MLLIEGITALMKKEVTVLVQNQGESEIDLPAYILDDISDSIVLRKTGRAIKMENLMTDGWAEEFTPEWYNHPERLTELVLCYVNGGDAKERDFALVYGVDEGGKFKGVNGLSYDEATPATHEEIAKHTLEYKKKKKRKVKETPEVVVETPEVVVETPEVVVETPEVVVETPEVVVETPEVVVETPEVVVETPEVVVETPEVVVETPEVVVETPEVGNDQAEVAGGSKATETSEPTAKQKVGITEEEARIVYEGLGIDGSLWEDFQDYQESNKTDYIQEAENVEDAELLSTEFLSII